MTHPGMERITSAPPALAWGGRVSSGLQRPRDKASHPQGQGGVQSQQRLLECSLVIGESSCCPQQSSQGETEGFLHPIMGG